MNICTAWMSIGVENVKKVGRWITGVISRAPVATSPLAQWVDTRKALKRLIKHGNVDLATPFFLPLASAKGFFRLLEPDLLADFLSIKPDDTGACVTFVRKYGVFAAEDLKPSKVPQVLVKNWKAEADIPFILPLHRFWETYYKIQMMCLLLAALRTRDLRNARELARDLGARHIQGFEKQPLKNVLVTAGDVLRSMLAVELANARLAPIRQHQEIVPVIATSFVKDALYLILANHIADGRNLRHCKNLRCSIVFVPSRKDQMYHDAKCQNLAKRYRQLGNSIERNASRAAIFGKS